MTILAINTAQSACDVAVLRSGETVAHHCETLKTGQDARLPALVEATLATAGAQMTNLFQIAVCVGPGSFTGVRIGVAYARGLALALKKPCIGVTSLQACIDPAELQAPLRVALQAKKRPPDLSFWTQLMGPGLVSTAPEEWPLGALAACSHPLMSDAQDLVPSPMGIAEPSAIRVAAWGAVLSPEGAPPSPAYVRPPDAALPGGGKP
ncbi:MAG: tRNA (adenosine(37)-N6)-threonylcarbamoyltransferase complex dimerization subunit type 1 TsaB [Pseudomonadota bacterium]